MSTTVGSKGKELREYWLEEAGEYLWYLHEPAPEQPYLVLSSSWEGEQLSIPYDQLEAVIHALVHARALQQPKKPAWYVQWERDGTVTPDVAWWD